MGIVLKKDGGENACTVKPASAVVAQVVENDEDDFVVPTSQEAKESKEAEGSDGEFAKLQDGENFILMLPTLRSWNIPRWPWRQTETHQLWEEVEKIIGFEIPSGIDRVQTCARAEGGAVCEWCRLERRLRNGGRGADASLAQALRTSFQAFANVVVLREDTSGGGMYVQPMRFGLTVRKALMTALADGETFCDPNALIPIRITKTGTGIKTRYEVKVLTSSRRRFTVSSEWKAQLTNLNELVSLPRDAVEVRKYIDTLFGMGHAEGAGVSSDDMLDDIPF